MITAVAVKRIKAELEKQLPIYARSTGVIHPAPAFLFCNAAED